MRERLQKFLKRLKQENLDGFIVSLPANISYLSGFTSCDAYLLAAKKEIVYFTDSRYTQEVKPKLKSWASLRKINGSVFEIIAGTCRDLQLKRIGFESRHMAYAEYRKIKGYLRPGEYLIPTHSLIESLRQVKGAGEIKKIREALKITGLSLQFIKSFIKPGTKELEIAAELERFIRYNGAIGAAFDIIVASGPNSAYPHHRPGQKRIREGEPVLVDIGVDYFGYKSDLTRVFFSDKLKGLTRRIYDIVLEAQRRAISKIRPGKEIAGIDALARNYIADKGYAKFFGHSLGHGVGLETHEAPSISAKFEGILLPGMVFTVEPAIYLAGKFGIRIEDMILVTKKGCEVLSGFIHK
ncbi:MAG: Xaa-Pro peptidase family protein [Candidatus Omnitrophica bacterium]|nr:Xaa-Pro peptidase family protein [Candidatus Omnitrophota bacterium]MDD5027368.1 Xaa-Pro peptidase family protein [Candidatus Omnitrophota bacterium]MDD5661823.1 Xaa-Pro peptidase family protein [Candidatus Omnitrophota bacterium]